MDIQPTMSGIAHQYASHRTATSFAINQAGLSSGKAGHSAKPGAQPTDSVTIGTSARAAYEALIAPKDSSSVRLPNGIGAKAIEAGFDLSRVFNIHEQGKKEMPNDEDTEYYWAARKSDPELDRFMYDMDKAKVLNEVVEIQNLLLKATMGTKLTDKEQKLVKEDAQLSLAVQARRNQAGIVPGHKTSPVWQ